MAQAHVSRVVLADLPGPGRDALASLIEGAPSVALAAQVSTLAELDIVLGEEPVDAVLLDDRLLRGGPQNAWQAVARLVVTGVDDDPAYTARAARIGALAWVAKEAADDVLIALLAHGPAGEALPH
jgi:hypothetical protein